jgi:hypothetical protein
MSCSFTLALEGQKLPVVTRMNFALGSILKWRSCISDDLHFPYDDVSEAYPDASYDSMNIPTGPLNRYHHDLV